jgi:hypothetical protein
MGRERPTSAHAAEGERILHRSRQRPVDESPISSGPWVRIPQRVQRIDARRTEKAVVLLDTIDHCSNFDNKFGQLLLPQGPPTSGRALYQRALQ